RCAEQLQGRTQSWDLGSLLIKPVQRVLKYPLLLKELSSITPPDDLDHENLITATIEIQKVADHINEIKRRKDIVERIVGDKKKTEMNVVKAHRIRQVTGLAAEATQDTIFDTLYQKFEDQQELARQLARDIQTWVRQVKDNFDNLLEFATSLEEVYSSFGGVRVRSMNQIKEFTKLASNFRMVISRELDTMIYAYTYAKIEGFLAVFENPTQVINKRGQKLLDYDRVRGIKARGDIPDKTLQESADMYVSINAQLVEELPLLFNLTRQYFDIIVGDLAMVQTRFYEMTCREWNKLMQHLRQDPNDNRDNSSFDAIIANYQREMNNHVQPLIDDIMPLNKEQWKMILANRGTMMDLGGTTDDDHSKVTTPSQNDDFSNSRSQGYSESSNNNNNNNNLAEPAFECVVIHDYLEPSMEALSVRKGDVIQVWVEDEDEQGLQGAWLYASISVGHSEHFGWVPSQFCRRL
ncbi:uncharacterized protein BX664DRAFT_258121, partial [Halteromyces radiatus]|uniref:uncharacterized protein n=1 Tax=Halteromyces radiatus TaxID=101107 RepID=UPI002220DC1D